VSRPTVFLHLSDIHFHGKLRSAAFDLDCEVRAQLEADLRRLRNEVAAFDGLLISGDIAFSGEASQYEQAREWIEAICALIGCPSSNVWTVPGNHDVDRSKIKASKTIRLLQRDLRAPDGHLDERLEETFADPSASAALFEPIVAYNEFASRYNCRVGPDRPYWEHSIVLNDQSLLTIRGLTSTFVSNSDDDDGKFRLLLGSAQCTFNEREGVEYLVMCHHPPRMAPGSGHH
jgi:3',5'-cyclic AMP phosphodiesterase CpdA